MKNYLFYLKYDAIIIYCRWAFQTLLYFQIYVSKIIFQFISLVLSIDIIFFFFTLQNT